jgi:hypothetical protein
MDDPAACSPARFPFPAGTTVPANVPWLPYYAPNDRRNPTPPVLPPPRLVRADGTMFPVSVDGFKLALSEPLEPGQEYRIVAPEGCRTGVTLSHAFKAGPAMPRRPLSFGGEGAGTLSVTTSVERYRSAGGPCEMDEWIERAAVARVKYTPSEGARAWAAIATLGFEVDRFNTGWPIASGDYGVLARNPEQVYTFYANCAGGQPQGNLAPGPHVLYGWFFVDGERFATPMSVPFNLSCGDEPDGGSDGGSDGGRSPDAGGAEAPPPGPDAGSPDLRVAGPDAGAPDAGAPDAAITPPPRSAASDGCSLGGSGQGSLPWLALAAAGAAALTRRRRSRR